MILARFLLFTAAATSATRRKFTTVGVVVWIEILSRCIGYRSSAPVHSTIKRGGSSGVVSAARLERRIRKFQILEFVGRKDWSVSPIRLFHKSSLAVTVSSHRDKG